MELKNVLMLLWKTRNIFLSVFFVVFFVVVAGTLTITPWYQVGTKVLLRKPLVMASILAQLEFNYIDITSLDDTARANHVSLATIRSVAENVVEDLDLKRKRYRYQIIDLLPFSRTITSLFGIEKKDMYKPLSVKELTSSSLLSKIFPRPGIIVSQYEDTDILDIDAKSTDIDEAVRIANSFTDAFVKSEQQRVLSDLIETEVFVDEALDKTREQYLHSAKNLSSYLVDKKIVDIDTVKSTLETNILSLETEMRSNQVSYAQADKAIQEIQAQIKALPLYRIASEQETENSLITTKKSTLLGYYISLAEALAQFTPTHPSVILLKEKITELERTLPKLQQTNRDNKSIEINHTVLTFEEALVEKEIDKVGYKAKESFYPVQMAQYKDRLVELAKTSNELVELTREKDAVDTLYTSLLKLKHLIVAVKSRVPSTVTIVESALTPNQSEISKSKHPNIKLFVILATMLGGFMAVGSSLLTVYLRDTIQSVHDFKAYPDISVLGVVEKLSNNNRTIEISTSVSGSDFSRNESIRTICHVLNRTQTKSDSRIRSLAISSISPNEGKSFITAALAVSSARAGRKVLLVDCNKIKSGLCDILSLTNQRGLQDLLRDNIIDTEVTQKTNMPGLTFLSHGISSQDEDIPIEYDKMKGLLQTWQKEFDLVLFDAPSTTISLDAAILGELSDGLLLVVEDNKISRNHFLETSTFLKELNVRIVGVVFNKVQSILSMS